MTSKAITEMSFLKIKAVRLCCKECFQENSREAKQKPDGGLLYSEDLSGPLDNGHDGMIEKENTERERYDKILNGEKFWRVPRQVQLHAGHKYTQSPLTTNLSTGLNSFPRLKPLDGDSSKVENMENGIWVDKTRSNSAPGFSYAQARVKKHKIRLPNICDWQTLSITGNQPVKSMVVKGEKLSSARRGFSSPDSNNNDKSYLNNESKFTGKNLDDICAEKLSVAKMNSNNESKAAERCHGDAGEDTFPFIRRTDYRGKTAYARSSRMFNTYLESRFGKSIYEANEKKIYTGQGTKRYQVYCAPVMIDRKMLYKRTEDAAKSSQETLDDTPSAEEKRLASGTK